MASKDIKVVKQDYKIVSGADDPLDCVIEKTGIVTKFTLRELSDQIKFAERTIKEIGAKLGVERARMQNIERHHPFVLKLSDEDLFTAHMYAEAKEYARQAKPKLQEFEDALRIDSAELEYLYEKFGFKKVTEKDAKALK